MRVNKSATMSFKTRADTADKVKALASKMEISPSECLNIIVTNYVNKIK